MKSVDALLNGLVDYAGLFPPASQDMREALESYASYTKGSDRAALARFIVPLARLEQLEEAATDLLPRRTSSSPWRLSVIVAEDVRAAGEEMLRFNGRHSAGSDAGHAVIDVAELKASTADEIDHQRQDLPEFFTAYFEIPTAGDVTPLVRAIARARSRAKVRTGGVTPQAFPAAQQVIDFIAACEREAVPFKATAGLHHAVRGDYRLTYEPESPVGTMYGFLNVFIAAALLHAGAGENTALAALEEVDAGAFIFEEDAIVWKGNRVSAQQIASSRNQLAISFGSCSFREPVDELARLASMTTSVTA